MLELFIKPMLGAFFYCAAVFSVVGDDRAPTLAPADASQSVSRKNASAPPIAANGDQRTNGQTTDSQADIIRAEGEARIARMPNYRESASTPSAANSYPPLPVSADSRAEELKHQADTLAAQGNLSKAMALYNEALNIAPRSAEIYRGRALALLRLGDRVQAQNDYRRFLDLDPQAPSRMRQEIQLFEQSTGGGSSLAGDGVSRGPSRYNGPSSYSTPVSPGEASTTPADSLSYNSYTLQNRQSFPSNFSAHTKGDYLVINADRYFASARDAFSDGDYDTAYRQAQQADASLPQARTHALMAQILLAKGNYSAAASEARAAAAMEPLLDSATLYSYYDFDVSRYRKQFEALEDYVRQNPSSAEARFLLGYEHRILNQKELAHAQLAVATVLDPLDAVAKEMLARDGVEVVGAEETAAKNMMAREGVGGSVRVSQRPPPPAPPAVPTEKPVKR